MKMESSSIERSYPTVYYMDGHPVITYPCENLVDDLPVCDIPMPEGEFQKNIGISTLSGKYTPENKKKFLEFIRNYIGADCWAVVLNDETLFNSYTNAIFSVDDMKVKYNKSYIQMLNEVNIRENLTDPSSNLDLYHYMLQHQTSKISYTLNIYMFNYNSYRIEVMYHPDTDTFTISGFMSEGYKKKFVDNTNSKE